MIWAKIDEFLMSAEPNGDLLKIIWDPRIADIALYWGVLYWGSSVHVFYSSIFDYKRLITEGGNVSDRFTLLVVYLFFPSIQ